MEQVTPARTGTPHWYAKRSEIALGVVVLVALLVAGGHLVLWAFGALIAAPLTLVATALMFLLPGLALLRLLWPGEIAPAERWTLAVGVSCALPPLLLLVSEPIGLRWNTWLCWLYLGLSALVLAWPRSGERPADVWRRTLAWRPDPAHLVLIAVTLVVVILRQYNARDLVVGPWGDSYHHTVIAQLLVDNGGLFRSWEPYAPLATFTYHYGWHTNVAWLHWLSGEPVTTGLLVVGQVQSALAAPLTYLLARRLFGAERPALWAALIVGFISALPAYYLNWGRYTQLGGQTILPVACVLWAALLDAATQRRTTQGDPLQTAWMLRWGPLVRLFALTVLVSAGLALVHYRVAVFAACFALAYGLYVLLVRVRSAQQSVQLAGVGAVGGACTALLVLPWLLRLREGALLQIGSNFASTNIGTDATNSLSFANQIFSLHATSVMLWLAVPGLLVLLWQRNWRGLTLVGWAGVVWIAANPYLVGLNGAGILTNFAVGIASYLVLAPLAGVTFNAACTAAAHLLRVRPLAGHAQVVLGTALLIWSLGWHQQLITPSTQLFRQADADAMEWIQRETPPDAKFVVNSFIAYGGTLFVGSDGGWWLPFMTGRSSNLPPITYASEAGSQPEYHLQINRLNQAILAHPVNTAEAVQTLRDAGFTHLYNGPSTDASGDYVDPQLLSESPFYELLYDRDGATIWRLR